MAVFNVQQKKFICRTRVFFCSWYKQTEQLSTHHQCKTWPINTSPNKCDLESSCHNNNCYIIMMWNDYYSNTLHVMYRLHAPLCNTATTNKHKTPTLSTCCTGRNASVRRCVIRKRFINVNVHSHLRSAGLTVCIDQLDSWLTDGQGTHSLHIFTLYSLTRPSSHYNTHVDDASIINWVVVEQGLTTSHQTHAQLNCVYVSRWLTTECTVSLHCLLTYLLGCWSGHLQLVLCRTTQDSIFNTLPPQIPPARYLYIIYLLICICTSVHFTRPIIISYFTAIYSFEMDPIF